MLLIIQSSFWGATSNLQKVLLLRALTPLIRNLPDIKRTGFISQIVPLFPRLLTVPEEKEPELCNPDEDEEAPKEEPKKKKNNKLGFDLEVANKNPEDFVNEEQRRTKKQNKLLDLFLPHIMEFFEAIQPGPESQIDRAVLSKATLQPILSILPLLLPTLKKYFNYAEKLMQYVSTIGQKTPLDLLKYEQKEVTQAESDEEEEESMEVEEEEQISSLSLGAYLYLLFMHDLQREKLPHIFQPSYIFDLCTTHMTALFLHPHPNVAALTFDWIEMLASVIPNETYSGTSVPPFLDIHDFCCLLRAYIDCVVRIPDDARRTQLFNMMQGLVSLLSPHGRYKVLWQLQIECPYASICSLLLQRWKQEFVTGLAKQQTAGLISPFITPKLLKLFDLTLMRNDIDLMVNLDVVIASLNFLRLVLLRGKVKLNPVNIWSAPTQKYIKDKLLQPLKTLCEKCLDVESRDVASITRQKDTIKQIKQQGLPDMSLEELDKAQHANINSLQILYLCINEVFALVNT